MSLVIVATVEAAAAGMDSTHIADQVLTASAALAGLLLVFLSNAVAGFESYIPQQRTKTVVARYKKRGWIVFGAFTLALLSALLSLAFYFDQRTFTVKISAIFFLMSLLVGLWAAYTTVTDIK